MARTKGITLLGRSVRSALLVILAVGGLGLVPASTSQALPSTQAARPSGQWSMFMNGPLRRGRTPIVGAQSSHLAWRISVETNYGGPVVGRDGTIYQGTFGRQLLALNPDGTTKWAVTVPSVVESTPAILADGRICFLAGGILYVVNPDGSFSWRFRTGGVFDEAAPAIGSDGTIYTAGYSVMYALHPDGTLRWSYDVGQVITGAPAVTRGGVAYVPSGDLYALDPTGSLLWEWVHPRGSYGIGGSPAVGADGTIYVNSFNPTVYAINPDGTTKWTYQADTCCTPDVPSSPALGADGTIYFGATHYNPHPNVPSVFALNPDGTLKWQYDDPEGGYLRTPPAIGFGHRVYAGSGSGFFA